MYCTFAKESVTKPVPFVLQIVIAGVFPRRVSHILEVVHEGMVVKSINGNADVKEFRKLLQNETRVRLSHGQIVLMTARKLSFFRSLFSAVFHYFRNEQNESKTVKPHVVD